LHFLSSVYRTLLQQAEGGDGTLHAPSESATAELRGSWLLHDSRGVPDASLLAVVRELGARGLLYMAIWTALLNGTADPQAAVARSARGAVRRVWAQALLVMSEETAGTLPRRPRIVHISGASSSSSSSSSSGTDASGGRSLRSSSNASEGGRPLQLQQPHEGDARGVAAHDELCVVRWHELRCAVPSLDALGLVSCAALGASVRFHAPQLPPHADSEATDPLSLSNLQRITRHKRLQLALAEAMVLGLTAYDDVTVRGIIEASADLWMRLQRFKRAHRDPANLAFEAALRGARSLPPFEHHHHPPPPQPPLAPMGAPAYRPEWLLGWWGVVGE
jgi:hypothetical protein